MEEARINVPANSPLPVPQTGQEGSSANNTQQANGNNDERLVIVPVWTRVFMGEPSAENRMSFCKRLTVDFILVAVLVYSLNVLFKW